MEQLSGLDAAFLALDSRHLTGHVGGIHIIEANGPDGRELTLDRLLDCVARRIHLVPPLRRRIVDVPFGLGQPYWLDAPDTDVEHHVRELTLPAPVTLAELGDEVALLHSRPLDRARPLWELHLIRGLPSGRSALYAKVHHAMIDGVAGQEISAALLDPSPDGRTVLPAPPPTEPAAWPTHVELLGRTAFSMARHPAKLARFTAGALRSAPSLLTLLASGEPKRAPATPFNRNVSQQRRVALATAALSVVQAIGAATGTTVNDIVLAACAGALRRWLIEHDALPDDPLVAAVPVSLRPPAADGVKTGDGTFGTKASVMLATLPTDASDPRDRLRGVRDAMALAKEQHRGIPATLLADAFELASPALIGLGVSANARLRILERAGICNLLISNVPGPNIPLYLAGHQVLASYPVSAVADGQGLNITVMSYLDTLHFGLTADRDLMPDLDVLAGHITWEIDELASQR